MVRNEDLHFVFKSQHSQLDPEPAIIRKVAVRPVVLQLVKAYFHPIYFSVYTWDPVPCRFTRIF